MNTSPTNFKKPQADIGPSLKVVSEHEFLSYPEGTVFMRFDPMYRSFDGLNVKSFCYPDLWYERDAFTVENEIDYECGNGAAQLVEADKHSCHKHYPRDFHFVAVIDLEAVARINSLLVSQVGDQP